MNIFTADLPSISAEVDHHPENVVQMKSDAIDGLFMTNDFLSVEEEAFLLGLFKSTTSHFQENSKQRQSLHFGPKFDYSTFAATTSVGFTPFPCWLQKIVNRSGYDWDQATLQRYPIGSGIPPHVDTHSVFDEPIGSLSFGSVIAMDFRPAGMREEVKLKHALKRCLGDDITSLSADSIPHDYEKFSVDLHPRSLLVMKDEARYAATHGIRHKKSDNLGAEDCRRLRGERWSITFRRTRDSSKIACGCGGKWTRWCDSPLKHI